MAKHTPGPWEILDTLENDYMYDISGAMLTIVATDKRMKIPEIKANVRLIASAPELLEVLEALVQSDAMKVGLEYYGEDSYDQALAIIARLNQ